ncbi:MAG: hypothetical protein E7A23_15220, partial [Enterobacter sp.]|nr:hypothetical protein [Enterobacter sp.]
ASNNTCLSAPYVLITVVVKTASDAAQSVPHFEFLGGARAHLASSFDLSPPGILYKHHSPTKELSVHCWLSCIEGMLWN